MCKTELEFQLLELAIIQACDSKYVAKIYDNFEEEDFMYIIMEKINGKDLLRHLMN
jgi:serine/threonine protein kinase